jgi:hypothetical protein
MSTPAQLIPDTENAHIRGGPRTDEGKSVSSKNAITHGLFATHDFIRPNELTTYTQLSESLHAELVPEGPLELNLTSEIRRAIWRLRRCGEVESNLAVDINPGADYIFDPMETTNVHAEKVQRSVDRARSQSHRLLHKCTAELRAFQTRRHHDRGAVGKRIDEGVSANPSTTAPDSSFCKSVPPQPRTPRNAPCPCKSGQKYKRCCGKQAPPMLNTAHAA